MKEVVMKTIINMTTGDIAEIGRNEPLADHPPLEQSRLELGPGEISIVRPTFSEMSMPPDLAQTPVDTFLAGQC